MEIEDKFEEIKILFDQIEAKLEKKTKEKEFIEKPIIERKNHPLHFLLENSLMNKLKKEADKKQISLSEHCRRKLKGEDQLDRIERKIDRLFSLKD